MIRLGVIGYGVRADMLMDELLTLPGEARLCAVADQNPERVKALMTKKGSKEFLHAMEIDKIDGMMRKCPINPENIRFYRTAEEMLDAEELDGVLVGTNCNTHTHFAQLVLERGIPLFLEKPVAVSRKEVALLERLADEAKAPVVVSFPLRVTRIVQEVRKIIDSGAIGKVEQVQAFNDVPYGFVYFHDWYRDESVSHGLFLQKATHDIDVINYLTGEKPLRVCAMKSKQIYKGDMPAGLRCSECDRWESCMDSTYHIEKTRNDIPRSDYCSFAVDTGNEDSGSLILRYASGMHAVYSQNFFARKGAARRGARLYGYKGTVEFDFASDVIKLYDHMSDQVTTVKVNTPPAGHGGGDSALCGNFLDLIRGNVQRSVAPLEAGITSVRVCLAAKESSEEEVFRNV
nr:Gfo/Idh/MocA family oxidoreductase [uncultured Eisenbergiella sp.]